MSDVANSEGASETEKPVHSDVMFPPFPDPVDEDFDDNISEEERSYYKNKFRDLNTIRSYKLHCTACDRHLGCSPRNERIRVHPMLNTLVCQSCHAFYNSGEFEKGDDGSELYCRWCGQGGQVYCCSDCPHVFCAKCIKRNFGIYKIREIESADDWKCFKCKPECLKDLRAICWAVLRYCDLKQKITSLTRDPELKAAYEKDCAIDPSECCKHKISKRNQKQNESLIKKKDVKKESDNKTISNAMSKMSSIIQVKKFASINSEDSPKPDKKAQKRAASPKLQQILVKNPISLAPGTKVLTPVLMPPQAKKMRLPNCPVNTTLRFPNVPERKSMNTYTRIKPKLTPYGNNCFNGFTGNIFPSVNPINDNINLSLESLTQGLDMSAMAALATNTQQNDDVVCTPDFPLEPLCEVTEDNDDDVQCITPVSTATPKTLTPVHPPPLITIPRAVTNPVDITPDNIIQMTENDVTVNESTGGLKFRVDPQTLSSNKMYRLPDGRIFAINANPNMPGGYSATIVAVTETNKGVSKGATFAAKLSSVSTSTSTPKPNRKKTTRSVNSKRSSPKITKSSKTSVDSPRQCDLNVPIEWYRYNLIDAVDALEYSLSRLHKLKKEATSVYLRTRSVPEMRNLHRTLERLLNTSTTRFNEIRDNLNRGLKEYASKKTSIPTSEDDDDVEILPDMDDDPIFIDENSNESNINGENQEVDLTGPGSSEHNESGENRTDNFSKSNSDPLSMSQNDNENSGEILDVTRNNGNTKDSIQFRKKDCAEYDSKINNKNKTIMLQDDLRCDENFGEMKYTTKISNNVTEIINENIPSPESNSNKEMEDEILGLNENLSEDKRHEDSEDNEELLKATHKIPDANDIKPDEDCEIQNVNDEIQDANDKMQDANHEIQDENDKMQDANDKMQNTNDIMQDANDEMQITNDDFQNANDDAEVTNDKIQGTKVSDELMDTSIKDDSVDDIESISTKSELPALHVT